MDEMTQRTLSALSQKRLLLVTGKGGVGKTQVTAALALSFAQRGKTVLCGEVAAEADASSPLAQALGAQVAPADPVMVQPGVYVGMVHPSRGHQTFLRDVLKVRMLADAAIKNNAIRRFLGTAPAFPEMGTLYRILELLRDKNRDGSFRYDTVILDLPATGHALALAQIPGTLLRVLPGGPIVEAVRAGLDILTDATQTGTVIVTLPETLPVSEALELAAGVRAHDIPIAGILLNRMPVDPFSSEEKEALRLYSLQAPQVLGLRTAARIDRSLAARVRLDAEATYPIASLPDCFVNPDELPRTLAAFFGSAP